MGRNRLKRSRICQLAGEHQPNPRSACDQIHNSKLDSNHNNGSGSPKSLNVGEIIACDSCKRKPQQKKKKPGGKRIGDYILTNKYSQDINMDINNLEKSASLSILPISNYFNNYYDYILLYYRILSSSFRKPTNHINITPVKFATSSLPVSARKQQQQLLTDKHKLDRIKFPFKVLHHDGSQVKPLIWNGSDGIETDEFIQTKDFLNKRQFRLTCMMLALLALVAACAPIESEALAVDRNNNNHQSTPISGNHGFVNELRNTRSLSSYDFKDWLPGLQSTNKDPRNSQPMLDKLSEPKVLSSAATLEDRLSKVEQNQPDISDELIGTSSGLAPNSANIQEPPSIAGSGPETQLMAPMGSSPASDHMLAAASKKKKKMKMMKKKKKMEKKHKEWKKGKKHKKKKYESKKKKGGSSKKKKGKKEKKKWGMEKKGHKKKGNFKKKKWGSKKKMKKGHKKGKKGHKLLKDKGHKKKGFKKVYHKEEWGKKKKWHDIKREKKWNTKAKKWKKKWHQEKGKKYKGKHMKKYHKKNKHGKKYKKEKKSKWKKHKGEKFKKGHKKKKEEYSKKKEGGKKKKMKKMKKEMKKKKKG